MPRATESMRLEINLTPTWTSYSLSSPKLRGRIIDARLWLLVFQIQILGVRLIGDGRMRKDLALAQVDGDARCVGDGLFEFLLMAPQAISLSLYVMHGSQRMGRYTPD